MAEGARQAGATVDVKRVPEILTDEAAKAAHDKLNQKAPVAVIADFAAYDAIIVGTGTRFGRMASQMAAFLDLAGGLWAQGALNGKVGGAFSSTGTQHGGQEMTLFSTTANLMHFGMAVVGLDHGFAGQMTSTEATGGRPYGATAIAGGDGSRQPSENELAGARYQGERIAETAKKLFAQSDSGKRAPGSRDVRRRRRDVRRTLAPSATRCGERGPASSRSNWDAAPAEWFPSPTRGGLCSCHAAQRSRMRRRRRSVPGRSFAADAAHRQATQLRAKSPLAPARPARRAAPILSTFRRYRRPTAALELRLDWMQVRSCAIALMRSGFPRLHSHLFQSRWKARLQASQRRLAKSSSSSASGLPSMKRLARPLMQWATPRRSPFAPGGVHDQLSGAWMAASRPPF